MSNRDMAVNIMGWATVSAEPAGASGAFWSIKGPRRSTRDVAGDDVAVCIRSIEQALDAKDAEITRLSSEAAAMRADLARVTGERDAAVEYNREVDAQFRGINNALDAAGVTTPDGTNCYGRAIEALTAQRDAALAEVERVRAIGRTVVAACYLRTHEFPEGDISDLDHSKLLPAVVALDAALTPPAHIPTPATTPDDALLIERDAALAEVGRMRRAATNLLALMDEVGTPDGDESDRVFARYEFDELRAALAPTPPAQHQEPTK